MKLHCIWIAFFLTSLRDGCDGFDDDYDDEDDDDDDGEEIQHHKRIQGKSISVDCRFDSIKGTKYFCRGECDYEHRLIETDGDSAVEGRYSLKFTKRRGRGVMTVSISQLTKADTGLYGCGLDRTFRTDPFLKFTITVIDAPPTFTPPPKLTSPPSISTRSYQTFTSAPESTTGFDETKGPKPEESGARLLWYIVGLVIALLLFLMAVLILCRKRASRAKEPTKETHDDNNTEGPPLYDEIREGDRQRPSPPVENINLAKYPEAGATDIYSLASEGAASAPHHKAPQDTPVYTQVKFSQEDLNNSAPSGHTDNVLYSVVKSPELSEILYSNVQKSQE